MTIKYEPLHHNAPRHHPHSQPASRNCLLLPTLCFGCLLLLASNLFLLYRASQQQQTTTDIYSSSSAAENFDAININANEGRKPHWGGEAAALWGGEGEKEDEKEEDENVAKNGNGKVEDFNEKLEEALTADKVPAAADKLNRAKKIENLKQKTQTTKQSDFDLDTLINHSKCKSPFLVTVAEQHSDSTSWLHKWLLKSNYFTDQREQACLTVQIASKAGDIAAMPDGGQNRLIIFAGDEMAPARSEANGKALFVATKFEEGQFRPGVDFELDTSVPDFDDTFWQSLPMVDAEHQRNRSETVACAFGRHRVAALPICEQAPATESELGHALFTVVPSDGSMLSSAQLLSAPSLAVALLKVLRAGSIPVLVGGPNPATAAGPNLRLPFAGMIRWEKATLWMPSAEAESAEALNERLIGIGAQRLAELRRNGRFILEHHLGNAKVLLRSILSSIRLRLGLASPPELAVHLPLLFVTPSKNSTADAADAGAEEQNSFLLTEQIDQTSDRQFEDIDFVWNRNPSHLDAAPLFQLGGADHNSAGLWHFEADEAARRREAEEKFTIVMLAYKRDEQLALSLGQLDGLAHLDRVVVIWNDVGRQPPPKLFPRIHVPIVCLNGSRNSLNNRFLALAAVRTQALFNMDDDFNTGHPEMLFSFRVWQSNRHAIVGPNFRLGLQDYNGTPQCRFNMVLSSGAFFHRSYLRAFSEEMAPTVRAHIDEHKNCEDIALNFLVGHLTGQSAIKTTAIRNTRGAAKGSAAAGLSARGDHYAARSECIKLFTRIFGYNSMVVSQFRVDTLLDGEDGEKCFKDVCQP